MKLSKILTTVTISSLAILLAACTPSAEKLNDQMADAAKDIKNGQMTLKIKTENKDTTATTNSDAKFQLKPHFAIKQNTTINTSGQSRDITAYQDIKNEYIQAGSHWAKLDYKTAGINTAELKKNLKGNSYRIKNKKLLDEMEVKNNEKTYTMSLKNDNKAAQNEIKRMMNDSIKSSSTTANKDYLKNVKISSVKYSFNVAKKTYYPTKYKLKMNFEQKGEKYKLDLTVNYSDINKVGTVKIPAAVKDNAIDLKQYMKKYSSSSESSSNTGSSLGESSSSSTSSSTASQGDYVSASRLSLSNFQKIKIGEQDSTTGTTKGEAQKILGTPTTSRSNYSSWRTDYADPGGSKSLNVYVSKDHAYMKTLTGLNNNEVSIDADKYNSLNQGMSQEQVIKILGMPYTISEYTSTGTKVTQLRYNKIAGRTGASVTIELRNDKATGRQQTGLD